MVYTLKYKKTVACLNDAFFWYLKINMFYQHTAFQMASLPKAFAVRNLPALC